MADITEIKCPCCGGALSFNVHGQNIKCPYCDTEFQPEDLRKYDEQLNTDFTEKTDIPDDNAGEFSEEELEQMNTFICNSCSGEIIAGPNTSATSCPYCGNPVLIKGRLTKGFKPRYIIPFKKTKDDAVKALAEHVKKKPLLPKVFHKENTINEVKAMYLPYWLYDADIEARIQYEGTKVRRWSDSNYDYTETSYYQITRQGYIGFDHLPVDASTSVPNDLTESIEPFDFDATEGFKSTYLAGYLADKFDVSAQDNSKRAVQRMKEGTQDAFLTTVKGYDTVNTKASDIKLFNTHYDYALYPIYILATTWRDTKYTFAMNGQSGKLVGNLPVSKPLVATYFSLFFLLFAAVFGAIAGGIAFFMEEEPVTILIAIIIGVVIGLVVTIITIGKMKKKNHSVSYQRGSASYYRKNSLSINVASDLFLYKKVVKRERKND